MHKKLLWSVIGIVIVLAITVGVVVNHKPAKKITTSQVQSSVQAVNNSVVITKTTKSVGQYLASPSGKTLYTDSADTATTSSCTGSCLSVWPPYIDTGSTTGLPANIGTITRTDDGKTQYTYKGKPLYYFVSDTTSDPVTGNGISGFYVAAP